jgi:hypothetical protein
MLLFISRHRHIHEGRKYIKPAISQYVTNLWWVKQVNQLNRMNDGINKTLENKMIKQHRKMYSHSYTSATLIRQENSNANFWNTTIYSYCETSTTTSYTALYTLKTKLNYPHALSLHHYRTTYMQLKTSEKPLST